jgi:hypothetical protein
MGPDYLLLGIKILKLGFSITIHYLFDRAKVILFTEMTIIEPVFLHFKFLFINFLDIGIPILEKASFLQSNKFFQNIIPL